MTVLVGSLAALFVGACWCLSELWDEMLRWFSPRRVRIRDWRTGAP